jgi:periplasmic protein TonB
MNTLNGLPSWRCAVGSTAIAAMLAVLQACSTPPAPPSASQTGTTPASPTTYGAATNTSQARSAKEYRRDAASHLYARQPEKIYKGRLPPMLYAVGVLNVDIDRHGQVQNVHWTRAPRHAPEVMVEIEKMVRAAAPFPVPLHMTKVTYTDVWLWHKSGQFQLDTLTEGQD